MALGYALTVHEAQGVTVDRAVLIADETTTAEAVYVGLTHGRCGHDAAPLLTLLGSRTPAPLPTGTAGQAGATGRWWTSARVRWRG